MSDIRDLWFKHAMQRRKRDEEEEDKEWEEVLQILEARARDEQRVWENYTPEEQVLALASEVERLRKQVAFFRPIVEALAKENIAMIHWPDNEERGKIPPDLIDWARAALAEADE